MPHQIYGTNHSGGLYLAHVAAHPLEISFTVGEGPNRYNFERHCPCSDCIAFFARGQIPGQWQPHTAESLGSIPTPIEPQTRITARPQYDDWLVEAVNGQEQITTTAISNEALVSTGTALNLQMLRDAYTAVMAPSPYTGMLNAWNTTNNYGMGLFNTIKEMGDKKMITAKQMDIRETNKFFIADRYGQKFRHSKGITEEDRASALNSIKRAIARHRTLIRRPVDVLEHKEAGGIYARFMEKRTRAIREGKKPINRTRHIAAEIEFLSKLEKGKLGLLLAASPMATYLCLKDDGSITTDGLCECDVCANGCRGGSECTYDEDEDTTHCECRCENAAPDEGKMYGHELVVCAPAEMFEGVLQSALAIINGNEAKGRVNKTCGLHIHLDARFSDYHSIYEALTLNQHLFYSMMPLTRKDGRYSKMSRYTDWKEAEFNTDRYQGINPHSWRKYQTIEVRLHSGTTNFNKIKHWVRLLQAVGYGAPKQLESLDDLFNCGIDPLTSIHCLNRLKLFQAEHKEWSWLNGKDVSVLANVIEQGEVA